MRLRATLTTAGVALSLGVMDWQGVAHLAESQQSALVQPTTDHLTGFCTRTFTNRLEFGTWGGQMTPWSCSSRA